MVSKIKFVCNSCGYESGKWYGRCPNCSVWNSFQEVDFENKATYLGRIFEDKEGVKAQRIQDIKIETKKDRIKTGFSEVDRVLGGGVVQGSVVLLSGDPGIGKSTLLLQIAINISKLANFHKVFYISGEESSYQLKIRIERIGGESAEQNKKLFIVAGANIDSIINLLKREKPDFIIVDSIQTMETANYPGYPGSIPQIRHATLAFTSFAKKYNVPAFLVGHVTKEGIVAGPMLLSHMVDVVLYLEGERLGGFRMLRASKNRFGDSEEVGIFLMREKGFLEIQEATNFFIEKKEKDVPGSCLTVVMEGTRPLLVEIQALVVPTFSSFARRVSVGISEKRLELLLAVIQKTLKFPLERFDVFLNVVGGVKILENASDLAVCLALISSFKNKPIPVVAISEVGLLGELRNVTGLDKRINEAKKFGFNKIISKEKYRFLEEAAGESLKL